MLPPVIRVFAVEILGVMIARSTMCPRRLGAYRKRSSRARLATSFSSSHVIPASSNASCWMPRVMVSMPCGARAGSETDG
jgi:hypothetical protein